MALRVLLIEDDPDFRALLRHSLLSRWRDAIVTELDPATDPLPAAGFDGRDHDLVLLDYQLGTDETGLDLLKRFRTRPGFPPVIMLTGAGDERVAVQAIRAGASDYLPKQTFSPASLARTIEEAVDRHGAAERYERDAADRLLQQQYQLRMSDYRLLKVLGKGASSTALLAERRRDSASVVVKVVQPAPGTETGGTLLARLVQEYQLISQLNHPNLARIHDMGFEFPNAYVIMEYFSAGNLIPVCQRGLELPIREALSYAVQVARGLSALHEANILHRDLKPANVMLRADGSAAIIDFGLIKHLGNPLDVTQMGDIVGTPLYMSPEQGEGGVLDARSDLYSLGVILFGLLTGTVPYSAGTPLAVLYKHRHAPIPRLPTQRAPLQELIDALLAKEPSSRPASAKAVMESLEKLRAGAS